MRARGLARGVVGLAGLGDAAALGVLLYATRQELVYVAFYNRTMSLQAHPLEIMEDSMAQQVAGGVALVAPMLAVCAGLTLLVALSRRTSPWVALPARLLDAALVSTLVMMLATSGLWLPVWLLLARLAQGCAALVALAHLIFAPRSG
jgi:hypothetical protein